MDDHEHEDDGLVLCWSCYRVLDLGDAEPYVVRERFGRRWWRTKVTYWRCRDRVICAGS